MQTFKYPRRLIKFDFAQNAKGELMIIDKNTDEVVISLRNLTKRFRNFTAVSNVSLDIKKGEIVGFLGPNGAGKTTTMKMIARLLIPEEGEIWIRGNGVLQLLTGRNQDYLLDEVGFLIENPAFYKHMTPRQILSYFAELKGYPKQKISSRVKEVVEMMGLSEWIDKKLGTFSKGMRQKIGIVSAIVHDPAIIVLDEPQTGLDPKARKEVRDFLKNLKSQGKTIFLSSHLLYEVGEIADKIGIIYHGRLIAFDTVENLEQLAQKSVLHLELYSLPDNIDQKIVQLANIVESLTGLDNVSHSVTYNYDLKVFEVLFNGNPKNQLEVFKALAKSEIDIIGCSVPRTNLLEDLYLNYISQDEEFRANQQNIPSNIVKMEDMTN